MPLDESFQTTSGLADEMDLRILEAAFVLDPKYKNDKGDLLPMLKLAGVATIDGSERQLSETFPIGNGWTIADDGARIVGREKVNNSTAYGKFIDALVAIPEAVEILEKLDGASTLVAATWVGFTLHLERTPDETFKIGGQDRTRKGILVPTAVVAHEVLGVQQAIDTAPVEVEIPADVREELTKLANSVGSFEEFVEGAYALDVEGKPYEDHVAEDGPAGFYATVTAPTAG